MQGRHGKFMATVTWVRKTRISVLKKIFRIYLSTEIRLVPTLSNLGTLDPHLDTLDLNLGTLDLNPGSLEPNLGNLGVSLNMYSLSSHFTTNTWLSILILQQVSGTSCNTFYVFGIFYQPILDMNTFQSVGGSCSK